MPATANRRIYVNWLTKTLQISDRNGGLFVLPPFVNGEVIPFDVVIVEPDLSAIGFERFNRLDISNLSIAMMLGDVFEDASPLAYQPTFTKDETNNVFAGELACNTAEFDTYIGSQEERTAYFEIEMQEGTAKSKIYSATVRVRSAVIPVSSTTPVPVDEYFTKAQTEQQFLQRISGAGVQWTSTSPNGLKQRILGVSDNGEPIDIIIDAP